MKKIFNVITLIFILFLSTFSLTGCGAKGCGHTCSGGQATCESKAVCSTCGKEYGDVLGHNYGEYVSNGEGTHTKTCLNDSNHKITEKCVWNMRLCDICNAPLDGISYRLINNDTEYEIYAIIDFVVYDLEVPSTYFGKPVTSIGHGAFHSCYSLTSIILPNSVTNICGEAFIHCGSLKSVVLGNNVKSIGHDAFKDCKELTSIDIPDSVTSIGELAFYNCYSLASITIGNGVTSIGDYAFVSCSSLTSIVLPKSIINIGKSAFSGCNSLASITFNGTKDEWENVTKGKYWYGNAKATFVTCTDGIVNI